MDTLEGNKLIAEFMGAKIGNGGTKKYPVYTGVPITHSGQTQTWTLSSKELKYHTSWDWLMPAWVKFNSLGLINFSGIEIRKEYVMHRTFISQAILKGDVIAAFELLSQAIEWYNRHQPVKK